MPGYCIHDSNAIFLLVFGVAPDGAVIFEVWSAAEMRGHLDGTLTHRLDSLFIKHLREGTATRFSQAVAQTTAPLAQAETFAGNVHHD